MGYVKYEEDIKNEFFSEPEEIDYFQHHEDIKNPFDDEEDVKKYLSFDFWYCRSTPWYFILLIEFDEIYELYGISGVENDVKIKAFALHSFVGFNLWFTW